MKLSTTLSAAFSVLSGAALVAAHGYVQTVTIGGKQYDGWHPFDDPYASPVPKRIVRRIPDDGPVQDINTLDLACNVGGENPAPLTADINAGDPIKWTMNRWPDDHLGPITVYMTPCQGSCTNFKATKDLEWFKIDQAGLANGKWASQKLIADNLSWTTTIPKSLKSGEYLVRFELLALHSAGAPQFYPSCTQVRVKNGGSIVPSGGELAKIPGIYNNAGKAIYGDIWDNLPATWPIAGPKVVSFAGGNGNNPPPHPPAPKPSNTASIPHNVGGSPPKSATSPAPSSTSTPKQCKRRAKNNVERRAVPDTRAWASHGRARRSRGLHA